MFLMLTRLALLIVANAGLTYHDGGTPVARFNRSRAIDAREIVDRLARYRSASPVLRSRSDPSRLVEERASHSILGVWFGRIRSRLNESLSREPETNSFSPRQHDEHHRSLVQTFRDSLRRDNPNTLVPMPSRQPQMPQVVASDTMSRLDRQPVRHAAIPSSSLHNELAGPNKVAETARNRLDAAAYVSHVRMQSNDLMDSEQLDAAIRIRTSSARREPSQPNTAACETAADVCKEVASERASGIAQHEPAHLPTPLGTGQRPILDDSYESPDSAGSGGHVENRLLEAGLVMQRESMLRVQPWSSNLTSTSTEFVAGESIAVPIGLIRTMELMRSLCRLPFEYYLMIALVLVSSAALVFSRRSSASRSAYQGLNAAPVISGLAFWPSRVTSEPRDSSDRSGTGDRVRVTGGRITTMIGLAIVAIAVAGLVHHYVNGEAAMQRPAMLMAAVGQGILLIGITAQLVHRARRAAPTIKSDSSVNDPSAINPSHSAWPNAIPLVPLNSGYAGPITMPVLGVSGHHSGQIAQLKAQLACVSEQLDQLVISEAATGKQ